MIAANLRASRLTLLLGASGVGKTSVLLAGVVPRLREPIAAARRGPSERAPLAVAVMREWRDPPLPRLAAALRAAVVEASGADDVPAWEPPNPLVETLWSYSERVRTLLVVLDQFEEYFLYHADETGPGTLDHELVALMNDVELRINVMISLREEAMAQLDRFSGRVPELFANHVRVQRLDRHAAREAIVRPLEFYAATGARPMTIEPALVEAVLDEVRTGRLGLGGAGDPGKHDEIETPFLQLIMERLWTESVRSGSDVLTLAELDRLGGAERIVSRHLADAMAALSQYDRTVAADVLQFLVTPSRTKISQSAADLAYWSRRPEADVRRVLEQLAGERRILRSVPPPAGAEDPDRYEVFHDVMAEALLEWSRGENERARLDAQMRELRARRVRRTMRAVALILLIGTLVLAIAVAGVR